VPGDLALSGLTTLAQSLRDQGAHCARAALGLPTDGPARHEWRVVLRATTRAAGSATAP
jgi:hypothetical protein